MYGYDYFVSDPGSVHLMTCPVCGDDMNVTRNVNSAAGFLAAMSGNKKLHDVFSCNNTEQDWHVQVIDLMRFAKGLPSKKLREIVAGEISEILKECHGRSE